MSDAALEKILSYPYAYDDGSDGYVFLPNGKEVQYHWSLAGPDGIEVSLRTGNGVTSEDLTSASRHLHDTRDVVRTHQRSGKDWPEHWKVRL